MKIAPKLYAVYSSEGDFLGAYRNKREARDFARMDGGRRGLGVVCTFEYANESEVVGRKAAGRHRDGNVKNCASVR